MQDQQGPVSDHPMLFSSKNKNKMMGLQVRKNIFTQIGTVGTPVAQTAVRLRCHALLFRCSLHPLSRVHELGWRALIISHGASQKSVQWWQVFEDGKFVPLQGQNKD
jgi:hypothetical protein